jgi:membrane-associated protein
MDFFSKLIDIFLHLDRHLNEVIQDYGAWTYLILFVIIFCETGLVATPFLPGDSLLFAAGALAATGSLNVIWLFVLLSVAAIAGDTVNYWIGHKAGPRIFHRENVRFLNRKHLDRTHEFYEKYGGKTIIIARFVPIIRTFAPFVAGIGRMTYWRFVGYNVIGGIVWIAVCVFAGFLFGNIPIVKRNFSLVIIAIVVISILPAVFEIAKQRFGSKRLAMRARDGEKKLQMQEGQSGGSTD